MCLATRGPWARRRLVVRVLHPRGDCAVVVPRLCDVAPAGGQRTVAGFHPGATLRSSTISDSSPRMARVGARRPVSALRLWAIWTLSRPAGTHRRPREMSARTRDMARRGDRVRLWAPTPSVYRRRRLVQLGRAAVPDSPHERQRRGSCHPGVRGTRSTRRVRTRTARFAVKTDPRASRGAAPANAAIVVSERGYRWITLAETSRVERDWVASRC